MPAAPTTSRPKGRTASKAFRRQQLIEATIDSIARRGFAETTLADVADGAGLSRGIVNFHFKSKTMLLEETLRFLAEEYSSAYQQALEKAGSKPLDRLRAAIEIDFDPQLCNRKKIAVWFAFWGEAKSRPTYLAVCDTADQEHMELLKSLCRAVAEDSNYPNLNPDLIASGLCAMSDGLWQSLLLSPGRFDRERAKRTCFAYVATAFPNHFPNDQSSAA